MPSRQHPIPLICFGRPLPLALKMESTLAPHFSYSAIITNFTSPLQLTTLLDTLNPPVKGIVVGGGYTAETAIEVHAIVDEWVKGKSDGWGERDEVKIISVPRGTLESIGLEGLEGFLKRELAAAFEIEW